MKRRLLLLIFALLLFLAPTAHAQTSSSKAGQVTLTFADGSQRSGLSSPDDVEMLPAAKGGHQLKFNLSSEELEWAASLQFQQVTVRFGDSEWEHPGDLFYSPEERALLYIPTSSASRAYTHYGQEAEVFALQAKSAVSPAAGFAGSDWFSPFAALCAEKGLLAAVTMAVTLACISILGS